jgi:hypothetical protein
MRWHFQAIPCLAAMILAGCGGKRTSNQETGATGAPADTSMMAAPAPAGTDTSSMSPSTGAVTRDTGAARDTTGKATRRSSPKKGHDSSSTSRDSSMGPPDSTTGAPR